MSIFLKDKVRIVIVCGFVVLVSGCVKKEKVPQTMPSMSVNVVAYKAIPQDLSRKISLVGTLNANESVEIKSEIEGKIEEIGFTEGERVEKGHLLFQVDRKKLQAVYDQAEADLNLAKTTAERYATLIKDKAVSQQEYDQTVANLAVATAAVDLAKERLEDAVIRAPFDGVMGERLISIGQYIAQGTLLSFIVNQDPIKVEFFVPERYLNEVKIGQSIKLNVAAFDGESFVGEVRFIDSSINEETRTALVKAYVPNPAGNLKRGMFANLDLIVHVKENAIAIPESALIIQGDKTSVFVIKEDGTVESRVIKTGQRINGLVEVVDGLNPNEGVVTEGYQKLGPGAQVNPTYEQNRIKKSYEII